MMGSGSVALSVLEAPLHTLSFRLPLICSVGYTYFSGLA